MEKKTRMRLPPSGPYIKKQNDAKKGGRNNTQKHEPKTGIDEITETI